jgi:soluble lytic murein transglycosylase-like protein
MSVAEQALDEEMKNGFTTGTPKEAIANALPYGLGGFLRTPQMQRVRQAQEDWVRAKLRLESGAAIPPDEMDREIQTYFPGLNETDPTIIEQKRKSRQQALSQVQESTGFKQNKGDHNGSYDAIIEAAAAKHGIDPELVKAVIHQESGGNPKAVSSAGAGGMMQLMPDTAKQLGVSDVTDPAQNIFAGTDYLTQQIKKYGDVALGLAAYNAGPGAVDKYKGIPPYAETKGYVTNIVGDYAAKKAKQKEDAISTARQFTQNSPVNQETAKKLARINALRAKGGLPTLNELPTNKGS